ncbi:MAG: hypothetical protein ACT4NY_09805 [Pseudonocardiales bacterium]
MSDVEVSFAEIDGQHVELLPARTLQVSVNPDPITPTVDVFAPVNVTAQ